MAHRRFLYQTGVLSAALALIAGCGGSGGSGGGDSGASVSDSDLGAEPHPSVVNTAAGGTWVSEVTQVAGDHWFNFVGATTWERFILTYKIPQSRFDYYLDADIDDAIIFGQTGGSELATVQAARLLDRGRQYEGVYSGAEDRTSLNDNADRLYYYFDAADNPDFNPSDHPGLQAEVALVLNPLSDEVFAGDGLNMALFELTRISNTEYSSGVVMLAEDAGFESPESPYQIIDDDGLHPITTAELRFELQDGRWISRVSYTIMWDGETMAGNDFEYGRVDKAYHRRPDLSRDAADSWRFTVTDDEGSLPYFQRPSGFVPAYTMRMERNGRLRMIDVRTGNTYPYYFFQDGNQLRAGGYSTIDEDNSGQHDWIRHSDDLLWSDDGSMQDGHFSYRFAIDLNADLPTAMTYRILTNITNYHDTPSGATTLASYSGTMQTLDFFRAALIDRVYLPATAVVTDAQGPAFTVPTMDMDLDWISGGVSRYSGIDAPAFAMPYNPLSRTAPAAQIAEANAIALAEWTAAGNDVDDFQAVAAMPVAMYQQSTDWDGTADAAFAQAGDGNQDPGRGIKSSDASVDYQVLIAEDLSLRVYDKQRVISSDGGNNDIAAKQATAEVSEMIRHVDAVDVTTGGTRYLVAPNVELQMGYGAELLAATWSATLASIEVTDGGAGYVEPPLVLIQGGGGSGASAEAVLGTGGRVIAINLTNPGTGYDAWPTVTLVKGHEWLPGSGATAVATRSVTEIEVDESGRYYTSGALIASNPGPGTEVAALVASPTISAGQVTSVTVSNGGRYSAERTFAVVAEGDDNASAWPVLTTHLTGATIIDNGTGYTEATVTIDEPTNGGRRATATAAITDGQITGITITDGGLGYTEDDMRLEATIAGDGTDAVVYLTRSLIDIRISSAGNDYINAPTVLAGGRHAVIEVTDVDGDGAVIDWNISNQGRNYGSRIIRINNAEFLVTDVDAQGGITDLVLISGGSDFAEDTTHAVSEVGVATVATASTSMRIGAITVIDGGSDYTGDELVTISGGGGSDAQASLNVDNGEVTAITIDNPGFGYSSVPTVSIAGPAREDNDDRYDEVLWASLIGWDGSNFVGGAATYGAPGRVGLNVPGPHAPGYATDIGHGWETMVLNRNEDGAIVSVTITGGNSKADYDAGVDLVPLIRWDRNLVIYHENDDLLNEEPDDPNHDFDDFRGNLGDFTDMILIGTWNPNQEQFEDSFVTLYEGDHVISAEEKMIADLWDQTAPNGIRPFGLRQNIAGFSEIVLTLTGDTLDR